MDCLCKWVCEVFMCVHACVHAYGRVHVCMYELCVHAYKMLLYHHMQCLYIILY